MVFAPCESVVVTPGGSKMRKNYKMSQFIERFVKKWNKMEEKFFSGLPSYNCVQNIFFTI